MTNVSDIPMDRRRARTQRLIFDAFADLVQSTRYDDIQVADIAAAADVGRSTFYEHFKDKNDVLAQSIAGLFKPLAKAATGNGNADQLEQVLSHIWERRALARVIFHGKTAEIISRVLQDQIHENLTDQTQDDALAASFLSAGLIKILGDWVTGRHSITAQALSAWIMSGLPTLKP